MVILILTNVSSLNNNGNNKKSKLSKGNKDGAEVRLKTNKQTIVKFLLKAFLNYNLKKLHRRKKPSWNSSRSHLIWNKEFRNLTS